MNLRNWGREHTLGLLLGLFTTFVAVFAVIGIFAWKDGTTYAVSYHKFTFYHDWTAKIISLASIANLFWFHTFLRREKWSYGMGVILATVISLIVILIFKFGL